MHSGFFDKTKTLMGTAPVLTSLRGGNAEEHSSDAPPFRLNLLIRYSKQAR